MDAPKPPNLNQKEVRNPKRSITNKEIEAVTKRGPNLQTFSKKTEAGTRSLSAREGLDPEGLAAEFH